ncbi:hypothetical protein [Anaerobiospirillum succiniciproducens]|uniref:hypothetical protein n=1 Tax=Anaerobiospirillum succiniciproducens TaxID=13335 RepID=UPI003F889786
MRLNNKFDALWKAVRRITEQTTDFSLDIQSNWVVPEYERIAIELKSGKDITISEVEIQNGLLTYKGQHVVLYIRDHGFKYERAIHNEKRRNKYHLSDCRSITLLKNIGRFERLVATTNTSEMHLITGYNSSDCHTQLEATVRLRVCRNCLNKLNYKDYRTRHSEQDRIYESFDLYEFFDTYSTYFKKLPSAASKLNNSSVYSRDWDQISKERKEQAGYCCQKCGVDLSKHRHLLHTHHINGVKSDNRFENLKVLCIACHKTEPLHSLITIDDDDKNIILRLRIEQRPNLLDQKDKANSTNTSKHSVQELNGLNNTGRQQEQKTFPPSSTSILGDYSSQSSQQSNYQKVSPQTSNSVREEQKTVLSTQNPDHKDTANRDHVAASKPGAVISTQKQDHKDTGTRDHVAESKPSAVISTQKQDHKETGTKDHAAASKQGSVVATKNQSHKDTNKSKSHGSVSKQGSVVATKNQSHKDTNKSKSHGSVSKQGTVFSTGKHEHKDGHTQPKVYIAKRPTIFSQSQKGGPSPYSSFMPAPGTAFEKIEWERSLKKAPYALHPILAPFMSHKWPAPEINYKVGNKTFIAAWPARKTAIDLRADEKYLYQGWTVYSSKDILRNT